MKQTMLLKLAPTTEQAAALMDTLHAFNDACNAIAQVAFDEKLTNKFELQKLVYGDIRTTYKLSSQLTIRAISKVTEAYKRDKKVKPTFRREGAMTFDPRVMSFKSLNTVSLLTIHGRQLIPFRVGNYQKARIKAIEGQADLIWQKQSQTWYLAVTLDAPEPAPDEPEGTLGVDLGIINLATDSDGETFSGQMVEHVRQKHARLRQALQKRGTKSAKRHLRKLSGKEKRFRRNTNHVISKHIVSKAKSQNKAIAIEDLRHIRSRTEARLKRSQRSRHSSWAFTQLRVFLTYKARLNGVPLHTVDPRNTSRTCSVCGHCDKKNRKSQAEFQCLQCEHSDNADRNAAINISRAEVMQPIVAGRA